MVQIDGKFAPENLKSPRRDLGELHMASRDVVVALGINQVLPRLGEMDGVCLWVLMLVDQCRPL